MDNNLNETEIILNQGSVEQSVGVTAEPSVVRGVDGFSPIATVTQEEDGARITITDLSGTTTALARNGEKGEQGERGAKGERGQRGEQGVQGIAGADGFSPIATVTKTGGTATITITDKNGTTTASVTEPSKTSDLTNDGADGTSTYVEADELATVATSGSYNDLSNKPTIPTAGTITSGSTGYAIGGDVYNALSSSTSGAIVPLSDYVNTSTFAITDKAGLITAINAGKGFYAQQNTEPLTFSGTISGGKIYLTTSPQFDADSQMLNSCRLIYDETTGNVLGQDTCMVAWSNKTDMGQGMTLLSLGKLTINIGSSTYEYDGMQDVNITIADGESMEF